MKKIILTFISIAILSGFSHAVFSQNHTEDQIKHLKKDIIYLKQDNYKIKNNIDSLKKSLTELELSNKKNSNVIDEVKNSNHKTDFKFIEFQDNTNQRFLRYKKIISTSLILSAIIIGVIIIVLIIIILKNIKEKKTLKNLITINEKSILYANDKNLELIEKYNDVLIKLEEQSSYVSGLSGKFSLKIDDTIKKINSFNEINNVRISETQKTIEDKFDGILKSIELSNNDLIKQLNTKISEIETDLTTKLNKLNTENVEQINLLKTNYLEDIAIVKAMIESKT